MFFEILDAVFLNQFDEIPLGVAAERAFAKMWIGRKEPFRTDMKIGEIASAMNFLHQRNVIHRDLKCQNVLVVEDETTRLMDFGLSRKVEDTAMASKTTGIGTSYYMAPEMVLGDNYDNKVDLFSFAIMMYEMLTMKFNPYKKEGEVAAPEFIEFKVG